jgi:hypothetical protein
MGPRQYTKGELLHFCIAFALRGIRLHRSRLLLTEEDRYRVADEAIQKMRQYGRWNELDDVVERPWG